jgi:hypothetical protein
METAVDTHIDRVVTATSDDAGVDLNSTHVTWVYHSTHVATAAHTTAAHTTAAHPTAAHTTAAHTTAAHVIVGRFAAAHIAAAYSTHYSSIATAHTHAHARATFVVHLAIVPHTPSTTDKSCLCEPKRQFEH